MRIALVVAGLLLGTSLAGPSAAQGVREAEKANPRQQKAQAEAHERKTGVPLSCRPASGAGEDAYQCQPKGEPPTILRRVWRWVFRLGRDPIAVLTLALLGIGIWQVGTAQTTMRRQLRAYLHLTPGEVKSQDTGTGFRFEARPWVHNKGQTPAYNVQYLATIRMLPHPIPAGYKFELPDHGVERSRMTLGPGQQSYLVAVADGLLSEAEIKQVKGLAPGLGRLVVYGTVTYDDAFKVRRHTDFCWLLVWVGEEASNWMSLPYNQEAT